MLKGWGHSELSGSGEGARGGHHSHALCRASYTVGRQGSQGPLQAEAAKQTHGPWVAPSIYPL